MEAAREVRKTGESGSSKDRRFFLSCLGGHPRASQNLSGFLFLFLLEPLYPNSSGTQVWGIYMVTA